MRRKQADGLWVVIHCEIMQFGSDPVVDEMVFHVSSSQRKAERYVKEGGVMPYSWWRVQRFVADETSEEDLSLFYDHKGGRIDSPPSKKAITIFKRMRKSEESVAKKRKTAKRDKAS